MNQKQGRIDVVSIYMVLYEDPVLLLLLLTSSGKDNITECEMEGSGGKKDLVGQLYIRVSSCVDGWTDVVRSKTRKFRITKRT